MTQFETSQQKFEKKMREGVVYYFKHAEGSRRIYQACLPVTINGDNYTMYGAVITHDDDGQRQESWRNLRSYAEERLTKTPIVVKYFMDPLEDTSEHKRQLRSFLRKYGCHGARRPVYVMRCNHDSSSSSSSSSSGDETTALPTNGFQQAGAVIGSLLPSLANVANGFPNLVQGSSNNEYVRNAVQQFLSSMNTASAQATATATTETAPPAPTDVPSAPPAPSGVATPTESQPEETYMNTPQTEPRETTERPTERPTTRRSIPSTSALIGTLLKTMFSSVTPTA